MNNTLANITTFVASLAAGCGAAIAIASTAAVSQAAPMLRPVATPAPIEVVRLEPVVVTVSKARFEAMRTEPTELARTVDTRKVTRG